jgi:hypothetical protein
MIIPLYEAMKGDVDRINPNISLIHKSNSQSVFAKVWHMYHFLVLIFKINKVYVPFLGLWVWHPIRIAPSYEL